MPWRASGCLACLILDAASTQFVGCVLLKDIQPKSFECRVAELFRPVARRGTRLEWAGRVEGPKQNALTPVSALRPAFATADAGLEPHTGVCFTHTRPFRRLRHGRGLCRPTFAKLRSRRVGLRMYDELSRVSSATSGALGLQAATRKPGRDALLSFAHDASVVRSLMMP